MDKQIEEAMKIGQLIHGLDLPDEVLLHNLKIINEELGITDEDIKNDTEEEDFISKNLVE